MRIEGPTVRRKRYLIVNADDFGQSPGVNRGVIAAYERGIVTSASLMVRWPAAAEAVAYARAHPDLSLGLHCDLSEWAYREDAWVPLYQVVPLDDIAAVRAELARQVSTFRRLAGRDPTHLDSHQHVHREEPVRSVAVELAGELGVPLRHYARDVRYCGDFYGQTADGFPLPDAITLESLARTLGALPPGIVELGCHPGYADDLDTMYRSERAEELQVLCDPRAKTTLVTEDVELRSFHDIGRPARASGSPSRAVAAP